MTKARSSGLGDSVFLSNRGFYIPKPIFEDGAWALLLAFVIGIVVAYLARRHAKRVQEQTGRYIPAFWIGAAAIIGLPVIAYFAAGTPVSFELPRLRGLDVAPETRGGILAVHKGQREAAESLGLRPNRVLTLVVLPQALRVIIPPLTSQYLNLTKNSSLAIATRSI